MNEEIIALRKKAKRSLEAAKGLHATGNFDFAVSRAYYAMFYIAEAMLLMKGKSFSKHSAVISAFYEFYVRDDSVSKEMHQLLTRAFDLRQEADYLTSEPFTSDVSQKLLSDCEEFLKATEKFFVSNP